MFSDCDALPVSKIVNTTMPGFEDLDGEEVFYADGRHYSTCLDASQLSTANLFVANFQFSSLFLFTAIDFQNSSNVDGIRVEYGISEDNLTTYYDERLSTDVSAYVIRLLN